jgi:hypothetical protein
MPLLATLLSLLGLVPFVACGMAALGPNPVMASRTTDALIGYAAVVLAFTGGVHWGFELQSPHQRTTVGRLRLGLAVLPLLAGWIALLLLVPAPLLSLALLIAAYIATLVVEHGAGSRQLVPPRYLWLRWGFTVVAAAMMITVFTLRLLGQAVSF